MTRPGERAWKENTTALDRVRSVVLAVSEPRSVEYIADEAAVSVETTRDHLDGLVELAVVLEHDVGNQPSYAPDPLYTRFQTIRNLITTHEREELSEMRDELQSRIDAWREEYSVDSLEALRDCVTETASIADPGEIRQTVRKWEIAVYRLDILSEVCSNYAAYTR